MSNLHKRPSSTPCQPEESVAIFIDDLEATMRATMKLKGSETEKKSISIRRPTLLIKKSYLYQPQVVSIGPQHRRLPNLQNLQDVKWSLLNSVISADSAKLGLRDFIQCIKSLEERARRCYQRNVELPSKEFVQILLLDSIFIISIIFFNEINVSDIGKLLEQPLLFSDLLLIENQIPFFVILQLWDMTIANLGGDQHDDITGFLQHTPFWKEGLSSNSSSTDSSVVEGTKHLLDLYYNWNVPIPKRVSKLRCPWLFQSCICCSGTKMDEKTAIPSATELYESGVKFKPKMKSQNMYDISFANGTLEIPTLILDSRKMSHVVNLLSHELANPVPESIVVGYVYFMDALINTKKDIQLLQKLGVIHNKLASNEDAAEFFNSLGEGCAPTKVNAGNNFYSPAIEDMMNYAQSCWRNQRTSLMHNYFNNPWTGISVFAGGALLILAFVQTFYTIFPRK